MEQIGDEMGVEGVGMEGTMADMLQAQPVQTREDRKRSGRPTVGGKGEAWDSLLSVFLADGSVKTKNGLPGVPYSVRSTLTAVKIVWSDYAPGVTAGSAPTDWLWLATSADAIIAAITGDVYATGESSRYLHALADVCAVLARRTSSAHVTDAQAPVVLYTAELQGKYRAAAEAGSPMTLHASPCVLHHHVAYPDWVRLYDAVAQLQAKQRQEGPEGKEFSPETLRLLGWADFAMGMLLPMRDGEAPLDVTWATLPGMSGEGLLVDSLVVAKTGEPLPTRGVYNTVEYDRATQTAAITLAAGTAGATRLDLSPRVAAALVWVMGQRESAVHMERLLPRRLTVDVILRRLSKGALKPSLKGKVLTGNAALVSWTTHAFATALDALDKSMSLYKLDAVDPISVVQRAVYPRIASAIPPLLMAGDDVPAAALVAE
jgi:hypothetical protein